jgi:hypothetical protein
VIVASKRRGRIGRATPGDPVRCQAGRPYQGTANLPASSPVSPGTRVQRVCAECVLLRLANQSVSRLVRGAELQDAGGRSCRFAGLLQPPRQLPRHQADKLRADDFALRLAASRSIVPMSRLSPAASIPDIHAHPHEPGPRQPRARTPGKPCRVRCGFGDFLRAAASSPRRLTFMRSVVDGTDQHASPERSRASRARNPA